MINSAAKLGFTYTIETVRNGVVVDTEVVHNIIPTEGINYLLNVGFKGGAQNATWYLGLYSGNYTATSADTMAAFPAAATESVAYAETARQTFTSGSVAVGSLDNSASVATFTSNAAQTIYGGFMSSSSVKAGTSGVLASVVRFGSPKVLGIGDLLKVTAGIAAASA
jgi:hypothetical protein